MLPALDDRVLDTFAKFAPKECADRMKRWHRPIPPAITASFGGNICRQLVGGHPTTSVATKKKPPAMTECEVKVRAVSFPAFSTKPSKNAPSSCAANPSCHGPAQALKESILGARAPHRTPAKTPRLPLPGRHLQRSRIETSPSVEIGRSATEVVATNDNAKLVYSQPLIRRRYVEFALLILH